MNLWFNIYFSFASTPGCYRLHQVGAAFFTFKIFASLLHPSFSAQMILPSLSASGINFITHLPDLQIYIFVVFPTVLFTTLHCNLSIVFPSFFKALFCCDRAQNLGHSLVSMVLGQLLTVVTNVALLSLSSHINLSVFTPIFSFPKWVAVWCRICLAAQQQHSQFLSHLRWQCAQEM